MINNRSRFTLFWTAYIISIAYIGIILLLPVIHEYRGLTKVPSTKDLLILYLVCLSTTLIIGLISNKAARYLGGITISIILLSTIFLNQFNLLTIGNLRAQVIYQVEAGNILQLGELRWLREIPFKVYYTTFQKYPLHQVNIHPDTPGNSELSRLDRFGLYVYQDNSVPPFLSKSEYRSLRSREGLTFTSIWDNDIEYLIYDPIEENSELMITSYDTKILILPMELINE